MLPTPIYNERMLLGKSLVNQEKETMLSGTSLFHSTYTYLQIKNYLFNKNGIFIMK